MTRAPVIRLAIHFESASDINASAESEHCGKYQQAVHVKTASLLRKDAVNAQQVVTRC